MTRQLLALFIAAVLARDVRASLFGKATIDARQQYLAVEELKRLVPPIDSHKMGGEPADDAMYRRFLSVCQWDPAKAKPQLQKDFDFRRKVKPRRLKPSDCPNLCRQKAWQVLMRPKSALLTWGGSTSVVERSDEENSSQKGMRRRQPLHPPHSCPPMQSWRYTKQGMPITHFECWAWRPDKAPKDERIRHIAYHMEHCIRRMPSNCHRLTVVMDLRGFETWMLPYVKEAVGVLRRHYPGRAGCMAFINVPSIFRVTWKVISPWLDDEIRGKTFFLPAGIDDVEKAVAWIDKKDSLKVGPI